METDDHLTDWLRYVRPDWMQQAACRGHDPAWWYPATGGGGRAAAICRGCPVRSECLEFALAGGREAEFGVWGGLSVRQRRMRRQGTAA